MERRILKELIMSPSLSGYEFMISKYLRETYGKTFSIRSDQIGNQYLWLQKDPGKPTIMISAHIDEIGYVLLHKTSDGLWEFCRRGGIDPKVIEGQVVDCWPDPIEKPDWKIQGVIGKTPIHLEESESRKSVDEISTLRIDFGNIEGPSVGCPCLPVKHWTELGEDLISAPGLDDKAGCAVVLDVMLRMKKHKSLSYNLVGVLMTQEEVGLRGATIAASKINPEISIDLDVSFASDEGRSFKNLPSGSIKLGSGPVLSYGPDKDFALMKNLAKLGKVQETVSVAGGTNTSTIQLHSKNAKTALISIPQRNMHTPVEICSWSDLEASSDLLVKFLTEYRV